MSAIPPYARLVSDDSDEDPSEHFDSDAVSSSHAMPSPVRPPPPPPPPRGPRMIFTPRKSTPVIRRRPQPPPPAVREVGESSTTVMGVPADRRMDRARTEWEEMMFVRVRWLIEQQYDCDLCLHSHTHRLEQLTLHMTSCYAETEKAREEVRLLQRRMRFWGWCLCLFGLMIVFLIVSMYYVLRS